MFVIEPFHMRHLLPVMRLAARTLSEEYPYEFYMTLAREQGKHFRVAIEVETGRVVGFLVGAQEPGLEGNVLLFGVDPQYQGLGIGRALLKDIQRQFTLEDVRMLRLEVRPDNARAIHFYEREGFSVTGLHARAYRDGSDALWMAKPLR